MKRLIVISAAAVVAIGMAACSSSTSTTSSAAGTTVSTSESMTGTTIDATEKDFSISLGEDSVAAGDVTFHITNEGPSVHEFVVFQTNLAPDSLPVKDGVVNEDAQQLTLVDEQEDIDANTTADLTVNLDAGDYVVICNLPGHYQQGMYAGLTVT